MAEYLDKSYGFLIKNFVRIGIFLLILGAVCLGLGVIIASNQTDSFGLGISVTLTGGFLFIGGILFIISITRHV